MYVNGDNVAYFDSFGVEYVPKEVKIFRGNKSIPKMYKEYNQSDSIMCGYFCIGFIDFILKAKSLLDYTIFSPNEYEKNDKIMLENFQSH